LNATCSTQIIVSEISDCEGGNMKQGIKGKGKRNTKRMERRERKENKENELKEQGRDTEGLKKE
jgi:hypothetical protein